MASRNKDERALVTVLTQAVIDKNPDIYVYIDRDAGGQRHTSSGWDFLMALDGRVVFSEAKIEKKILSPWQKFVQCLIKKSRSPYRVVRFWDEGEFFTVDDNKKIAISDAQFNDFL